MADGVDVEKRPSVSNHPKGQMKGKVISITIVPFQLRRDQMKWLQSTDQLFSSRNKSIEWIEFGEGRSITERR